MLPVYVICVALHPQPSDILLQFRKIAVYKLKRRVLGLGCATDSTAGCGVGEFCTLLQFSVLTSASGASVVKAFGVGKSKRASI